MDKRHFTDSNTPEGPWLLLGGNGSGAIHAWNTLDIPEQNMREGFDNRGYRLNQVEATKVRSYLEIMFKWFLPDLFNYLREHGIPHQIRCGENQPLVDEGDGVRHLGLTLVMEPDSHDGEDFDIRLRDGKKRQTLGGKVRPKSLCVTLDGKDGISNAARVRTGAVIATRWRHAFSMVYDT